MRTPSAGRADPSAFGRRQGPLERADGVAGDGYTARRRIQAVIARRNGGRSSPARAASRRGVRTATKRDAVLLLAASPDITCPLSSVELINVLRQ